MVTERASTERDQKRQKEIFSGWAARGTTVRVHPEQCIPFTCVRKVSRHGVDRLESVFRERGFYCLSGKPLLFELSSPNDLANARELVQSRDSLSDAELKATMAKYKTWYGVVDGAHRIAALLRLTRREKEWDHFMFNATLVPPETSKKALVQAARANNDLSDETHRVEATIHEQLLGMKQEVIELMKETGTGKLPTPVQVARAYCGNQDLDSKCASTQRARVALHMSEKALDALEEITSYESKNVEGIEDARVYRRLITYNVLKTTGAPLYSASPELQAAALYRVFDNALEKGKHQCSKNDLIAALEGAKHAFREMGKMDKVLGGDDWPLNMQPLKNRLLRTSQMDSACESWKGNDRVLLPVLKRRYLEVGGAQAGINISEYESGSKKVPPSQVADSDREDESESSDDEETREEDPPVGQPQPVATEGQGNTDTDTPQVADDSPPKEVQEPATPKASAEKVDPGTLLRQVGIRCYTGRWQEVRAEEEKMFEDLSGTVDLVLSDIPYDLPAKRLGRKSEWDFVEDEEIDRFVQMSRRMLKPGGYLVVFHSVKQFPVVATYLENARFHVCHTPTIVTKEQSSLQKSTALLFPQNSYEVYTIATTDTDGASRTFYPKLDDRVHPYKVLKTPSKRKFNVITDVPTKAPKLCQPGRKRLVRPSEKPVVLLMEILDMFCPEDGLVLDPYAGTFSTGLACIETGRRAVLVEADPECTVLATKRLVRAARRKLAAEEHRKRMLLDDGQSESSHKTISETNSFDEISTGELSESSDICEEGTGVSMVFRSVRIELLTMT